MPLLSASLAVFRARLLEPMMTMRRVARDLYRVAREWAPLAPIVPLRWEPEKPMDRSRAPDATIRRSNLSIHERR